VINTVRRDIREPYTNSGTEKGMEEQELIARKMRNKIEGV
jgi:hypothetical protein